MTELLPIGVLVRLGKEIHGLTPVTAHKRMIDEMTAAESWAVRHDEPFSFVAEIVESQTTAGEEDPRPGGETIRFVYVDPPLLPAEESHWAFQIDDLDPKVVFADHVATNLAFAARQLLLCANLASPGSISALSVETQFEGYNRLDPEWMLSDVLWLATQKSRQTGWPKVRLDLPLHSVWDWAQGVPGFAEGVGRTSIGRALAAVSHLLSSQHGSKGEWLLWSLLGLEALYCRGRAGLGQQLRAKSEALLGSPTEYKKMVTGMYKSRSNFVHGGLDVPFKNAPIGELPGFTRELGQAEETGVALLIATLQTLISEDRTSLEFEYHVVD